VANSANLDYVILQRASHFHRPAGMPEINGVLFLLSSELLKRTHGNAKDRFCNVFSLIRVCLRSSILPASFLPTHLMQCLTHRSVRCEDIETFRNVYHVDYPVAMVPIAFGRGSGAVDIHP
jgi:hypothetical protein